MKYRRGLSFVEILVGALILSVLALGLFQTLRTGYMGTRRTTEESQATVAGTALLEALVTVPFSLLPEVPPGTEDSALPPLFEERARYRQPSLTDSRFTRTVEVAEVSRADLGPWGPLKRIRVTVRWLSTYKRPSIERELVFQTLVTEAEEVWR